MTTLALELSERRDAHWEAQRKLTRQDHPRASSIGPCGREMAYAISDWDKRPLYDGYLLQRFERGVDIERLVIRDLIDQGWNIVGGQVPFEITETVQLCINCRASPTMSVQDMRWRNIAADTWEHECGGDIQVGWFPTTATSFIICTGHADGRIAWNGQLPVFEVKSIHPNIWGRINSVEDFFKLPTFWHRYPLQLLTYLFHYAEELGIFILDDCLGHQKFIEVHLEDWLDETEEALQRCRAAALANLNGHLPDFHKDPTVCMKCWAREAGVCSPPMDFSGQGTRIIDDEELAEDLGRMDELKKARDEYNGLDNAFKARMKATGPGEYVIGNFTVHTKRYERAKFHVPKEDRTLKFLEKYMDTTTTTTTTWERLPTPTQEPSDAEV